MIKSEIGVNEIGHLLQKPITKEIITKLMLLTACIKEGLQNLNDTNMKERLIVTNDKIESILMDEHERLKL